MVDSVAEPILRVEQLTKRFPGVVALRDVSFDLRPGEIHALCGENGAGKSTLIKALSGIHPHGSYDGRFFIHDEEAVFHSVSDAEHVGIAVIYQELALVDQMSVAENIALGAEPTRNGLIDWDLVYSEALHLLSDFHIDVDPVARVCDLGTGKQQLVEIVKGLRKRSRILILDEPTAALTESEVAALMAILRNLRQQGIACIYISHKLDEVFAISDRITVLRDGQVVSTCNTAETNPSEVIKNMVARDIKNLFPRRPTEPGDVLLRVEGLNACDDDGHQVLHDIAFEVRKGQVLGIGGLMGSGRSETLLCLFGGWGRRIGGQVELNGKPFAPIIPRDAIASGLVLVSEDRKRYGLILDQSIGFNLSLSSLETLTRGFIDRSAEVARNREVVKSLRIKAPSLESTVQSLSGGNQQKVVIGKALLAKPDVIFLDEPTRGIDVAAKLEVYELINQLTDEGKAVVLISSELPELLGMSDRIIMMAEGRIAGEFRRDEATEETLLAAAIRVTTKDRGKAAS
ncbi:MAG: ATP-binding cassette domain-containing protein [Proteobacteria bacterium]|nr:ATP-binding cassette domain-containing protein [Pseudomonadota bacterium]